MGKLRHYAGWAINSMFKKNNRKKTPLLYYWTKRYLFTLVAGLIIIGVVSIFWIRHNALENKLELTKLVAQEVSDRVSDMELELEDLSETRFPFLQDRQQFINNGQPLTIYIKTKAGDVITPMQERGPINNNQQESLIQSMGLANKLTVKTIDFLDNRKASVIISPIKRDEKIVGAVYIIQPHDQLTHINREEYQLLGLLLTSLALLGWFVIYFLSKKMAKPVEDVANGAQKLMSGNYDIRLNEEVQEKELHELVLSFNELANRLQVLEGLRTQLLAGVTHELKTPITSVSALIQAVNDNIVTEDKKKQFLTMSLKEAKRLQSMVEDLLDFNSFSAGSIKVNLEKMNLQSILKEIAYQWEIVHDDDLKNIELKYVSPEHEVFAMADSVRLQQIVVNLLNNSLHALKGQGSGKLTIGLVYDENYAYITVEDNGYGIPEEEKAFIFERFYRGKNKKDVERGLGLGLPYSMLLAKAQHGHLSLQTSDGSSTIFLLKLPLVK